MDYPTLEEEARMNFQLVTQAHRAWIANTVRSGNLAKAASMFALAWNVADRVKLLEDLAKVYPQLQDLLVTEHEPTAHSLNAGNNCELNKYPKISSLLIYTTK